MNPRRWLSWRAWVADWQLKLLGVVVAVGLWVWVHHDQTLTLTLTVPLEFRSPPQTLRFARRPPSTVEVRLQAHRDAIPGLTPTSVRVVADLSRARGRYVTLPLSPGDVVRPDGVRVLEINPNQLLIEFDNIREGD